MRLNRKSGIDLDVAKAGLATEFIRCIRVDSRLDSPCLRARVVDFSPRLRASAVNKRHAGALPTNWLNTAV